MCRDFQEEIPVAAGVDQLVFGWLAQWEAAQYEGPGIVTDLLPAILSLVPDELNGLQVFERALRETDGGQCGLKRSEGRIVASLGPRTASIGSSAWNVMKP